MVTQLVYGQIVFPSDTFLLTESKGPTCRNHMNKAGVCKRLPECFYMYTQLADIIKQTPCRLANNPRVFGVCCPNASPGMEKQRASGVSSAGTLFFQPPNVPIPDLKPQDIQNAVQAAQVAVQHRFEIEKNLFDNRVVVQPDTPVNFHLNLFPTSPQTLQVGKDAIRGLESSIQLVNQYVI